MTEAQKEKEKEKTEHQKANEKTAEEQNQKGVRPATGVFPEGPEPPKP
jgi:hypothetical protein